LVPFSASFLINFSLETEGKTFQVDIVYLTKTDPLSAHGKLKVSFPYCDLPVNQLFAEVFFPNHFDLGSFEGLKEIEYWSKSPNFASYTILSLIPFSNHFCFIVKQQRVEPPEQLNAKA
jgi:hypothetical protein